MSGKKQLKAKSARAQLPLGTYVYFCSYIHFFQIAVYGYHFRIVFTVEFIPMVKKYNY